MNMDGSVLLISTAFAPLHSADINYGQIELYRRMMMKDYIKSIYLSF